MFFNSALRNKYVTIAVRKWLFQGLPVTSISHTVAVHVYVQHGSQVLAQTLLSLDIRVCLPTVDNHLM